MTDAITVKDLKDRQDKLQTVFDQAQKSLHDATTTYEQAKAELVAFNNKFGRVLALMKED